VCCRREIHRVRTVSLIHLHIDIDALNVPQILLFHSVLWNSLENAKSALLNKRSAMEEVKLDRSQAIGERATVLTNSLSASIPQLVWGLGLQTMSLKAVAKVDIKGFCALIALMVIADQDHSSVSFAQRKLRILLR
jgi:hypothetical protein